MQNFQRSRLQFQQQFILCFGLALLLFQLVGCAESVSNEEKTSEQTPVIPGYPLTITDDLERQVTFDSPPQRIISLSPSNTELICSLGLEERMVGVTTLCDYPPAVQDVEKVGDFNANSISLEEIVALKPDLIISGSGFHRDLVTNLERLNLNVVAVEPKQLEQIYERLELLGKICNVNEAADKLVSSLKERVERVRREAEEVKPTPPLKVFYQIWNDPLSSTGNVSFIGEMLTTIQVENIFADLNTGYSPINEEALLIKNPDIILVPMYHGGEKDREAILSRESWQNIKAIKNNRVHFLPDDEVSRHGPRFVDGLEAIFKACYPEASLE
ncbi:MAG: ABC transporter substrate-binding protein [Planctomycetaceae bacterium]